MGDIGKDLTDLDVADETAKKSVDRPRDPVTKKFVKQPQEEQKPAKDESEPEKDPEIPSELEKPVEEPKPSNIRALGKAYDELKGQRDKEWMPKIQSLEAKTKEYERTIEELRKTAPDLKPVTEKLTALEKERDSLLQELRFSNFQKHPDYIKNFKQPLDEKWAEALAEVDGFEVTLENGSTRPVNASDLSNLGALNLKQRGEQARAWFGDSAPTILGHVKDLIDLSKKHDKAIQDAKKAAADNEASKKEQGTKETAEIAKAYSEVSSQLVAKYPKWFGPDESDPQGNELLKKGFDYGATVFDNKPDTINGETRVLTPVERVKRLAVIKAKAANHDRLVARLKAEQKRASELEAKLAEYESSEPPTDDAGSPGKVTNGDWQSEIEAEIHKLDRR
jgi:hypothetical protein